MSTVCEITIMTAGSLKSKGTLAHAIKKLEVVVDKRKQPQLLNKGMAMKLARELPPTAVGMRMVACDSTNGNTGTG